MAWGWSWDKKPLHVKASLLLHAKAFSFTHAAFSYIALRARGVLNINISRFALVVFLNINYH